MNYYLIAPAKTFHSTDNTLTYSSSVPLKIGQIVEISLGKNTTVGIVSAKTSKPEFETKEILRIIYPEPLPNHLIKALFWLNDYYRCPLSAVVQAVLPRGIAKKRRPIKESTVNRETAAQPDNPLSPAQKRAIKEINNSAVVNAFFIK